MSAEKSAEQRLLAEAIRLGADAASRATRYMLVSKTMVDAAEQALKFLETGRGDQARSCLRRGLASVHKLLT